MNNKRFGRQEPTIRMTLPYAKTLGKSAIETYQKTGRTALPWQVGLINDMMAVDKEGLWVHSRFGYSVPRQNGKNEVIAIRELEGLKRGERILHTAHRTSTSRAAWERLTKLLEAQGIVEECKDVPVGYDSGKSKGQEFIKLNPELGGGVINFRTRTTTGGLGETYDLLVIDEAQEYQDDQESALKYTIVSSDNPQTIYLGTPPTAYSSGTKFPDFRKKVLCGELKNAAWSEWSVEQETDIHSVDAWYETNPSLGYKLTERAIEDEIGDDVTDFNIQRLGLWIKYNQKSAISATEWDSLEVAALPALTGPLAVGLKFGKDGLNVCLSIAARTNDGKVFVEALSCRSSRDGIDWIIQWLVAMKGRYSHLVCDGANGQELLENALKEAKLPKAVFVTVSEFIDANVRFEQAIYSGQLVHMEQPALKQIVTNCEKRTIGSSGGFGYKSIKVGADVAILDSIILAHWEALTRKEKKKQSVSI